MTEIVVCSGKGGTGKTSVVASLIALAEEAVLADCDVDAANLHLVLEPTLERTTPFSAGHIAWIDPALCQACGTCQERCHFSAIDGTVTSAGQPAYVVDPLFCEGCGVCVHFCPHEAIAFPTQRCGEWFLSRTTHGPLVHAALDVGAENSGKLVTLVREQARKVAQRTGRELILIDGPPGIGCPVTAALTGTDLTLLVTEPSLAGLHDLGRIADLAAHFNVPALVCINKHDLSPSLTRRVEDYCQQRGLPVIGKIPYEPLVNEAQAAGRSLIEHAPQSEAAQILVVVWHRLRNQLAKTSPLKG